MWQKTDIPTVYTDAIISKWTTKNKYCSVTISVSLRIYTVRSGINLDTTLSFKAVLQSGSRLLGLQVAHYLTVLIRGQLWILQTLPDSGFPSRWALTYVCRFFYLGCLEKRKIGLTGFLILPWCESCHDPAFPAEPHWAGLLRATFWLLLIVSSAVRLGCNHRELVRHLFCL